MLHGVLGNKKNMRTFSRNLAKSFPDYQIVMIDHRGHGDSAPGEGPHTVDACASDVLSLMDKIGATPDIVCGHSFGGKVALAVLDTLIERRGLLPSHVFVLDSLPGVKQVSTSTGGKDTVGEVIDILRAIPLPIESKEALIGQLQGAGLDLGLAQWMTTNIKPDPDGAGHYQWTFDLQCILELFESYKQNDYWPLLHLPPDETQLHFVRAGKNPLWTDDVLEEFEDECPDVNLHYLPEADHWVHISAPKEVHAIMAPAFEHC
jgi:pimeloyl-ACP methyl ester carboxylesterase